MSEILFNLKNTVIIIIISEFLKNFMSNKKNKKYIGICTNLLILSYLFFQIMGLDFSNYKFNYEISRAYDTHYENKIISEYEKNVSNELMEEYKKNDVFSVFDVITKSDEQYNIISVKIHVNSEINDVQIKKIIAVTEGTGIEKYEIIKTTD